MALKYEKSLKITDKLIVDFANMTDDKNPIHLDENFASKTFFKTRIAHGMISANLIATLLSENFPGAIYLSQTLKFLKAVKIGDTMTAKFEILEKNDEKLTIHLKTFVENQNKEITLDGEAKILMLS